jgi:hypothetical protein
MVNSIFVLRASADRRHIVSLVCVVLGIAGASARDASAQPLGTFRWQLQPYCNVLSLNVIQQGDVFILEGFDDQCAGTGRHTSVVGTGFVNPDGSIGVGLTTVMFPGGAPVHVDARIHVASFSGPWNDSAGNAGGFVFTPAAGIGGERRSGFSNGVAPHSIAREQFEESLLDDLPPPERFTFQSDGSFTVLGEFGPGVPQLVSAPVIPAFAWISSAGSFRAGLFSGESGGGLGMASWAGGRNGIASGDFSFAFGDASSATGYGAVALGAFNGACGSGSIALGIDAHTSDAPTLDEPCGGSGASNAFVFSDGSAPTIAGASQFAARATGGFYFYTDVNLLMGNKCELTATSGGWACSSDRALKERFVPLDGEEVLRKLAAMPVDTWSFIAQPGIRHAGPVAQDFRAAFGLGTDDTTIGYTDINGINMRAIQALDVRTRELADTWQRLQDALQAIDAQATDIAALKTRLAGIERLLATLLER